MPSDTLMHPVSATAPADGARRIAELWPDLPDDVRLELLDIAEAAARVDGDVEFRLTPDELASVEAAKRDFAEGRTLTHDEFVASMKQFLRELP